ncbi:MAG: NADH-quinone oxidoreductase subunit NuoK [Cyclobacteriaceae bacterium]
MNKEQSILLLSCMLFCTGVFLILNRKNLIHLLIGLELMLNSANINLVYFSTIHGAEGITMALFIMLVAVCEAAVGLAIFLRVYRYYKSSDISSFTNLREP